VIVSVPTNGLALKAGLRVAMRRLTIVFIILAGLTSMGLIVSQSLDLMGYEGQLISVVQNWGALDDIEVKQDTTIGQTFVAPANGLYRIDVLLLDYGRHNTQPVTFHLRHSLQSTTDLFTQTFMASEVRGPTWLSFHFPPLPESAGQTYFFYLESPASTEGDAITFGGVLRDFYPQGEAYLNDQASSNADVAFRTYYAEITTGQKIRMLAEQLVRGKPAVWGKLGLYGGLLGIYLLGIVGFLLAILLPGMNQSR
jgi:hypothetical protein